MNIKLKKNDCYLKKLFQPELINFLILYTYINGPLITSNKRKINHKRIFSKQFYY